MVTKKFTIFTHDFIINLILLSVFIFSNFFLILELPHVYCNKFFILLELPVTSNHSYEFYNKIYLENLPLNSLKECQPQYQENGISLKILLENLNKCGFVRSINKLKVNFIKKKEKYWKNLQKHKICNFKYVA